MRRIVQLTLIGTLLVGCATQSVPKRASLSENEKTKMAALWALFVRRDPGWPRARTEWLALSEAARNTLVENLIRTMSDSYNANRIPEAQRAAGELVLLDRLSLDYLVFVVGAERNSQGLRMLAVSCLSSIGTPAVPGLISCLDSPRFQARRLAIRGLGRIRDAAAIQPIIVRLLEDSSFVVRREAASALGEFDDPRVPASLIQVLKTEDDVWVVDEVARSLGRLKCAASVSALVDRLQKAEEEEKGKSVSLSRTIREALNRITGLAVNASHDAFRAWRSGGS